MDNARLKQLATYNLSEGLGLMPVEEFVKRPAKERQKLLWQWSTAKQTDFADWKTYLEAHGDAYELQAEITETKE